KRAFDFFNLPTVLIRGTVPYEPELGIAFPRYQHRTIFPAAILACDFWLVRDRLKAIQEALDRPGKQGLLGLLFLRRETHAHRSTLEPPGGLDPLDTVELPQPELPMPARRE